MAFSDIFNRKRRPLDEAEGEEVSPVGGELAGNEAVRRKQRMLLAGVAGMGLVLSSMWIFSGDEGEKAADADGAEKVEVSTKDLVNRNLSQQEWMALSENRFESTENQLKSVKESNGSTLLDNSMIVFGSGLAEVAGGAVAAGVMLFFHQHVEGAVGGDETDGLAVVDALLAAGAVLFAVFAELEIAGEFHDFADRGDGGTGAGLAVNAGGHGGLGPGVALGFHDVARHRERRLMHHQFGDVRNRVIEFDLQRLGVDGFRGKAVERHLARVHGFRVLEHI